MSNETIPLRKDVPDCDKWDLTQIYKSTEDWENDLKRLPSLVEELCAFKGHMGESLELFLGAIKAEEVLSRVEETVYHYASLQNEADQSDSVCQQNINRVMMAFTDCDAKESFYVPELLSIPQEKIDEWLKDERFKDYRVYVKKLLHHKEHVLSEKEERILALQHDALDTPGNVFSLLTDVDMKFGSVKMDGKDCPLTHTTWSSFMECPDRNVRKEAYSKFYGEFSDHANTLASLYAGSVKNDVFVSRARGYSSSLEAALFGDKVPVSVYKNLIDSVHKNFPALHKYYSLRKKILGLDELRHYDVSVPLVKGVKSNIPYDEAVEILREALSPLGKEYTDILCHGLKSGWVDKYENRGKHSGAFSSGDYVGYPYILVNYKADVLRHLFTLAHEGGHSMHSWYSVHNNPFMSYSYTIFEAEVASTFNEELVFEYLLKNAKDRDMKLYLLSIRIGDILATLHRQTMFAEYELMAHQAVEEGRPLSTENLRSMYRKLLEEYFGPEMHFEEESDLEGLRIPHFYNAFYVYKYSTGISASLALAKRVTEGGEKEREDYFKFLKSGGSRYPIESLRVAGVDMEKSEPVQSALDTFAYLVDELEKELLQ